MRQALRICGLALALWLFAPTAAHSALRAKDNASPALVVAPSADVSAAFAASPNAKGGNGNGKGGDEVTVPKDKPKKSKKNPNDDKDDDPDDGNAGGGNDNKKLPNDGPQND